MYRYFVSFFTLALTLGSVSVQAATGLDIVTYGDSITAGLSRTFSEVVTCPAGVSFEPGRFDVDDTRDVCYGNGVINQGGYQPTLVNLLIDDGFTPAISNYGFSGIRTDQMISMLSGILSARPNAQYVVIMAGANDAVADVSTSTVVANLSIMVASVQNAGLIPVVATVTPNTRAVNFERNSRKYSDAIRVYAESNNILLADSREAVGSDWLNNHSGDNLHLSEAGNIVLANVVYSSLSLDPPQNIIVAPIISLLLDN